MRRSRSILAGLFLPTLLVAAVPVDSLRGDALYRDAKAHLSARAFQLGLDRDHGFAFKNIHSDEFGSDHVRVHQTYKGVRVFEGEAILHMRGGQVRATTDALVRGLHLNVQPSLEPAEALAAVQAELAPQGPYATEPTAELVIVTPEGRHRPTLVYHVHTELENGVDETSHRDFFVDAQDGQILESWDTLHTGAAKGTGNSQWYGQVSLDTNTTASGYELRDVSGRWLSPGAATYDLNGATSGTGSIYTDLDNVWGDGTWYNGTSSSSANGQTAAVDAARGLQATYDFYKNVFGRNGIDNTGKAPYSRVHYNTNYDNAFWSDNCFCMTYGDGTSTGSHGEADLDTVGHEGSHGVCFATANLNYRKESGGLNEGNSDIFGTCVEFWVLGGGGPTVPNSGSINVGGTTISANYKMFENSWAHPYPNEALRWQYKPSRDGKSPDFYTSTIGRLDVHYSSGVANHFFFLLAHGSQVDAMCDNIASPMANGVTSITGLGNDKAARIWYQALTAHMTSTTNYSGARAATMAACDDLIAAGKATAADKATVALAWKAVNVVQ